MPSDHGKGGGLVEARSLRLAKKVRRRRFKSCPRHLPHLRKETMDDTSKSILLQVAFKAAIDAGALDTPTLTAKTKEYYGVLVDLHSEFGVDPQGRVSNFPPRSGGGAPRPAAKPLPASVTTFADKAGVSWNDFRDAKSNGEVVNGFPEFKTTDNKTSVWIYKQDGSPDERAPELIEAADQMKSLAAPM